MRFDAEHPLNARLIASQQRKGAGTLDALEPFDAKPDAYYKRGCHPDAVKRLWKELGRRLPADCRAILFGSPVLIEPSSGVMIAKALGTSYLMRVSAADLEAALSLGCTTTREWSDGKRSDLRDELGPDWVFGNWVDQESDWIKRTFTLVSGELS